MKTLIAVLLTVNLFGNVSPDYITTNYYEPSVVISFDTWKSESLSVKILSPDSEVILNDIIETKDSEGIKYNLKNLASGKYIIKLENDVKMVEETVILFDGKIVEKDAVVYFKPMINIKDNFISTSFLSYNGDVKVTISNDAGIVFDDKASNTQPFNKVYNVNALESGLYTIRISNDKVSKFLFFEK